ncbi:DUF6445 family protein [Sphingopyxis sp. CCNWLW253]|uniref:DUF6445 family protein n=1 Tax=unclassified Sphingopyxis TaxID=2614943 RepID=UPI003012E765
MTSVRIETIGTEAQPLVILDDFAPDPDGLHSRAQAADFAPALNHFPGVPPLTSEGEMICRRGYEPGGAADYWVVD